jgi:hypothetical protein
MALFPTLSAVILVKIWGMYSLVIGGVCIVAGVLLKNIQKMPERVP